MVVVINNMYLDNDGERWIITDFLRSKALVCLLSEYGYEKQISYDELQRYYTPIE